MKYGCMVLLGLLGILALFLIGGTLALLSGGAAFETPKSAETGGYALPEGYGAQEKLSELALRDSGQSSRRDPIVLTDGELSAFLARHLAQEGIPFSPLGVKLFPDIVEIQGQTRLRNLFKGFPFYFLPDYLPSSTINRPVWVTVRGTIGLDGGSGSLARRQGRLDIKEFSLGNQGVGGWVLWFLLGPERLRWPLPAAVETIKVQYGRIVITSGP